MNLQFINEAGSLAIALIMGIFAYLHMSRFIRMLFVQLTVWILFYISSYAVTIYQRSHHLHMNNSTVFNIAVPVEFLLLTLAVCYFFNDRLTRFAAIAAYFVILAIAFLQLSVSESGYFVNYAMVIGSIVMTALFILVLYRLFKSGKRSLQQSPELWASLGLVLYFAGNVPFISAIPFLNEHSPTLSDKLFHYITDNLANIRYLLLALAFWLSRKNRTVLYTKAT